MVERFRVSMLSGISSLPSFMNQIKAAAEVGKSGS